MGTRLLATLFACASACVAAPARAHAEPTRTLVVIANPRNKVSSLTRAQLRRLFLKTQRRWPDGRAVMPLNVKAGRPTRVLFDRVATGLSAHEASLYWIKQRVRGHGAPPRSLHSARLLQRIVSHQPEAVGYVLRSELSPTIAVKILRIDGYAPGDARYPLVVRSTR